MASRMTGAAGALQRSQDNAPDIEHQLDLVRSAVALLAAGGARRVTLIGLVLDADALRNVGSLVRANGMVMRSEPGHVGCDITVEAIG